MATLVLNGSSASNCEAGEGRGGPDSFTLIFI